VETVLIDELLFFFRIANGCCSRVWSCGVFWRDNSRPYTSRSVGSSTQGASGARTHVGHNLLVSLLSNKNAKDLTMIGIESKQIASLSWEGIKTASRGAKALWRVSWQIATLLLPVTLAMTGLLRLRWVAGSAG
jgi:hypothetical protein